MSSPRARSPWPLAALAVLAAACIVWVVSFRIFDTDLWMHLVRAKAMLALHAIPKRNIWTWPIYGAPERNAAWGFALLLWPFWALGGILGLFVWRWAVALGAFGLAWTTSRRIGARGLAPLVVMVACAMVYRQRAQPRPETVAVILLGLELWLLETRRQGGRDRAWWIVAIAWIWPNVHVSFYLGWIVTALFAWFEVAARPAAPKRRPQRAAAVDPAAPRRTSLGTVLAASILVSFLNPFGVDALRGPLDFLSLRREPLYQGIGELHAIDWSINWQNGLPLWMLAWPLLQLWRMRGGRGDRIEGALWLVFTAMAFSSQRFLTFWSVVAAPYLARDLAEWLTARRARPFSPPQRFAVAAAACLALTGLESTREAFVPGVAFDPASVPGPACDFMAAHDVRGRGFNYFEQGGYLLWRFWPERDRLPFMTTIPELATPQIRLDYQRALGLESAWRDLDRRDRFDFALLERLRQPGDRSLESLDADSSFALVFFDDVSALFVRIAGAMAPLAARSRYRWLPAGPSGQEDVVHAAAGDSAVRAGLRRDLERAVASSPLHGAASSILASVLIEDRDWDAAEKALLEARRVVPGTPKVRERLAIIARGRAAAAPQP